MKIKHVRLQGEVAYELSGNKKSLLSQKYWDDPVIRSNASGAFYLDGIVIDRIGMRLPVRGMVCEDAFISLQTYSV
ncbi:MAG: hypothetical protein V7776_11880 [Halopseudomonas aestusnigri]